MAYRSTVRLSTATPPSGSGGSAARCPRGRLALIKGLMCLPLGTEASSRQKPEPARVLSMGTWRPAGAQPAWGRAVWCRHRAWPSLVSPPAFLGTQDAQVLAPGLPADSRAFVAGLTVGTFLPKWSHGICGFPWL